VIRQFWGEVLALSAVAAAIAVLLLVSLGPVISNAFNASVPTTASTPATTTTTGSGRFGGRDFGRPGVLFTNNKTQAANLDVHLSTATLDAQSLLIIVGLGMGLALLTSIIPAWYVSRIKPAEVLRRA
jgi:ABC-type lipoprotein release transport system permease subunit